MTTDMTTDNGIAASGAGTGRPDQSLRDETVINVAGILRDDVGSKRTYDFSLQTLPLADDLAATGVAGAIRLTRLVQRLLADIDARATVALECGRCLRTYDQPIETSFGEEYRQTVDLKSGVTLAHRPETDSDE